MVSKAIQCDEDDAGTPVVCSGYLVDQDKFMGVGWPVGGPGAYFFFEFFNSMPKERLTCETLGLRAFAVEPGRERCKITEGELTGMTVIVDHLCAEPTLTFFDDAYKAKDPEAGAPRSCKERHSHEAPQEPTEPLRCPDIKIPR